MYGIATSVTACLRAGTRADVAWTLDPDLTPQFDPADAVALTPGGGRLGSLLAGAIDSRLVEEAAAGLSTPRVLTVTLHEHEAAPLGLDAGDQLRILIAPASTLPEPLFQQLVDRRPVSLVARLDAAAVTSIELAEPADSPSTVVVDEALVTTVWRPVTTLVVMGSGPIADAIVTAGNFVGWNVVVPPGTEAAVAMATSLSPIDGVVVMGHDTESVGRVIQTALVSRSGYIGSLGPMTLQETRVDWLSYRGVTDLSRVSGPAGLDIGARNPAEIAVAVIAEMISLQTA